MGSRDGFLMSILRYMYGDFEREDVKKFSILGVAFLFVIGIYWTLRPIKDTVFISMIGSAWIGRAKIVSLLVLFVLVALYSKLVDMYPRHQVMRIVALFYCVMSIVFGALMLHPTIGLENHVQSTGRILGWAWYVFVESYGSILVALFWGILTDITPSKAARYGFPFVVTIGQLGSILGPVGSTYFRRHTGLSSAWVIIIAGMLILAIPALLEYFTRVIPKSQLAGFHGENVKAVEKKHEEIAEPGFFDGLWLLVRESYLLGIFALISIYEIIVTVIDFHFKSLVEAECTDKISGILNKVAVNDVLDNYAMWVNIVSLACLLLGISNIQKRLGVKFSLALMPFIIGIAVLTFWYSPLLNVLMCIMIGAKAFNYALNGPTMKQLYVPTTEEVRYKSQAWIETFGSRVSKGGASGYNDMLKGFIKKTGDAPKAIALHISIAAWASVGLLGAWLMIALFLGGKYEKAVRDKKVVC
jgi:AAA family ATP:ADP antiporter